MNCNRCGTQILNGESFCRNCGNNINQQPNVQPQSYNQPNMNPNQQPNMNYNVPNKNIKTVVIVIGIILFLAILGRVIFMFVGKDIINKLNEIYEELNDTNNDDEIINDDDINKDSSLIELEDFFNTKFEYKYVSDVYGEWIFEESNGAYVFNKENTYTVYIDGDRTDNYCEGSMKLRYGVKRTSIETGDEYEDYSEDDGTKLYYLLTYPNTCKSDGTITQLEKNKGVEVYALNIKDNKMFILRVETNDVFELIKK